MEYAALFIGVNQGPRGSLLSYAESDAIETHRLLVSNLAYGTRSDSRLLLGAGATRDAVRKAVARMRGRALACVVLFFSGHGSPRGILLADGVLSYDELAKMLHGVGAERPIVILDTCNAGAAIPQMVSQFGGVGGLEDGLREAWIQAVQTSMPGIRVYAAVADDQSTFEDHEIGAGRFSWCLRRALRHAPGQFLGPYAWVTEQGAFVYAAQELRKNWPNDGMPILLRPRGTGPQLPLVLAQSAGPVGNGAIVSIVPADRAAISVLLETHGRQFIPTHVRVRVFDVAGRFLGSASRTWEPAPVHGRHRETVAVPWLNLQASNDVAAAAIFGYAFGLLWEVTLLDDCGHILDSAVLQYFHVAA